MRQLWTDNLINGQTTYKLEPGQFGNFLIRYSGIAQAGKTVALTDCGNVVFNIKGESKINVDVELLSQAANLYGGYIEVSSVAGGAFAFSIVIPGGYWYDKKNVWNILDGLRAFFQLTYGNMNAALIVSGTVVIYGKPQAGIQSYYHKILSNPIVASGAATLTNSISEQNIIALYVKDPTALTDSLQITKDKILHFDGDTVSELVWSNWIHNLESASTLLALEFAESGNIMEANSLSLGWQYHFTAGGTLEQYYSSIQYVTAAMLK